MTGRPIGGSTETNQSGQGVSQVPSGNQGGSSYNSGITIDQPSGGDGGYSGGYDGGGNYGGNGGESEAITPAAPAPSIIAPTSNPTASSTSVTASSMSKDEAPTSMTERQKAASEKRKNANVEQTPLSPTVSETTSQVSSAGSADVNEIDQEANRPTSTNSIPPAQQMPTMQASSPQQSPPRRSSAPVMRQTSSVEGEPRPDIIDNFPYLTAEQVAKATENGERLNMEETNNNRFDPYNRDFFANAQIRRREGESDEELRDRLRQASYRNARQMREDSHPYYRPDATSYRRNRYQNEEGEPAKPKPLDTLEASVQVEGEDFASSEDAVPTTESRIDRVTRRFEEAREMNAYRRMNPLTALWVEGTTFEQVAENPEYERLHFTPRTQNAINLIRELYHCSTDTVFGLVMDATSLGIDNNKQVVKERPSTYEITEDQFVRACNQIYQSQIAFGHPMGVVGGNYMKIGGTNCYPAGYVDYHTLREITRNEGSALYGTSTSELRGMIADTWRKDTMPDLVRQTHFENRAQREAVFNYVRGNMSIDGETNYAALGIRNPVNHTFYETLDASQSFEDTGDMDLIISSDKRGEIQREAEQKMERKNLKQVTSSTGETELVSKNTRIGNGLHAITTMMRAAGICSPELAVSGLAEHVKGNALTMLADRIILRTEVGTDKSARARYKPSKYLTQVMRSSEARETMAILQMLENVGGMDAVRGFAASIRPDGTTGITEQVTMQQAVDYVNKWVRGLQQESDNGNAQATMRLQRVMQFLPQLTNMVMTGGGITRSMDANRFLEAFLLNEAATENVGERFIDVPGLEEAIEAQGLQRVMFDMATQHQGTDALLSTSNLNLGRRSPLSCAIESILRKNGVLDFASAMIIDKYVTYGVRFIELYFPMSNTISYAITHGLIERRANATGNWTDWKRTAVDNQLGAGELHGLRKCLIYDFTQLGSTLLMGFLWMALHNIFGGDDDDEPDESMKYDYREYAFGGTKLVPAWWLSDLTGWALPFGTALYVSQKYGEPDRTRGVLVNGIAQAMDGSAVFDTVNLIRNSKENFDVLERLLTEEGFDPSEEWTQRSLSSYGEEFVATFIKNLTPAVVRNYAPGSRNNPFEKYERSAYTVYTDADDARSENRTQRIEDYDEILRRSWAKSNPIYGAALDIMNGINPFTADNGDKTGYLAYQMPIATKTDQVMMAWYDQLNLDDNWRTWDRETKDKAAEELIRVLQSFDSYEDAIAQGFVLPWNARENLKEYCLAQKIDAENQYLLREEAGEYGYLDGRRASNDVQQYKKEMQNILDYWVYNSEVPSSLGRYRKLISDTEVNYMWADGTPADAVDYWTNIFSGNVVKTYTPIGARSSWSPVTPITETGAYNDEIASGWYREGVTDLQGILDRVGSNEIKLGQDAGQLIEPTIMGSQDVLNRDLDATQRITAGAEGKAGTPTIGRRSYEYVGEKLPEDFTEEDLESAAARCGIDYGEFEELRNKIYGGDSGSSGSSSSSSGYGSKSYGGGYSSRSYSGGGGGGGSSYNPKIYSSKQRIYANRAQGLNTRQPYKATNTYLRPGFATKGSREAYKRSDI